MLNIASQLLKFCIRSFFPEGSSIMLESTAANPASLAASRSVSGATNFKTDASPPSDV